MYRYSLVAGLALLAGAAQGEDYPEFPGERFALGRSVWVENCATCHAYGIAGAPLATDASKWEPRVAKGRDVLYEHALEGFYGPGSTMMPARGGNDSLSDEQVTAAVDYMVKLATGTEFD
ncbi:c-type cytochrome [Haliea sp. E17]|uniref:c-type cytochrome n=1 Tax=Haliea sp. E17 TaxID=3401576 RepID=UPI003AB0C2C0